MNYRVTWNPPAEGDLAAIWVAAVDRRAVTDAAAQIDALLAYAPLALGESRTSSVHRVVYHDQLGVEYEVIEDDKRVIVQAVFARP